MKSTFVIPEIQVALSVMISLGFDLNFCQIYIFDQEFQLVELLEIQNKKTITIQTGDVSPLVNLTDIAYHTKKLLTGNCGWQHGFPESIAFLKETISDHNQFHLALDLFTHYSCLILFSNQQNEPSELCKKDHINFIQLLQLGLNSYLKSKSLERIEIWADKTNTEIRQKDFLLVFNNEMALVKTRSALVKLINSRLKSNHLFPKLIIELTDNRNPLGLPNQKPRLNTNEPLSTGNSTLFKKRTKTNQDIVFDRDEIVYAGDISIHLDYLTHNGKSQAIRFPIVAAQSFGVLWLFLDRGKQLTPSESQLYETIALQIGAAIENIGASEQIKSQLEELIKYQRNVEIENTYLTDETKIEFWRKHLGTYGEAMQYVNQLINKVAPSNSTVLIQGETGTGKELIERAIHAASSRKNNIMVKLNCASLPTSLIESELFGHEKGSFTGAAERHIGKFELAENGTLFLDEIGEMPLEIQVKVLRAIQEREIERIGGTGVIKINVRIIAATNRDLHKEVLEGRFRSDLYYRVNVFPIMVPRLKDRKEDIKKLAIQFVEKFSKIAGKRISAISDKCLRQMMQYDWPGNVREMEHLIERTILLTQGTIIKQIDLGLADRRFKKSKENEPFRTIDENEREHILFALSKTNGKVFGKGGAAELLGIHFSTLNSRMKKLGIQKVVVLRN